MLHNLEMPTQIYHMAALGLSEFWKTAPQLHRLQFNLSLNRFE